MISGFQNSPPRDGSPISKRRGDSLLLPLGVGGSLRATLLGDSLLPLLGVDGSLRATLLGDSLLPTLLGDSLLPLLLGPLRVSGAWYLCF